MSDYQDELAKQGKVGELALNKWLKENGFAFVYLAQDRETFATLFAANLKRPDFLVLIDSIGLIAVDAKKYKKSDRFGKPAYSLKWQEELKRTLAFERLFRIPVWYAYLDDESNTHVWYWISALRAVEVGTPQKGIDEEFLWILRSDCVRVTSRDDFAGLYKAGIPDTNKIAALGEDDRPGARTT
jgi:hypothetical protein